MDNRTSIFRIFLAIIIIAFAIQNCTNNVDHEYIKSIEKWDAKRISSLKKPNSWLTLAGLFWLEQGKNTFGSGEENDFVFPEWAPVDMGYFELSDTTVYIHINAGIEVMSDSTNITSAKLRNDNQDNTTILKYKSLTWYLIKRGNMFGIRVKDSEHPNLKNFKGIERFPVDKNWRISATLIPADSQKTIKIPNVLGQISDAPSPGALVFEIDGKKYSLDPIGKKSDEKFWLIFGDATNGEETYGAGRFLYTDTISTDGTVVIDFNKSYNPPCVFSPFATCPLPPEQNILDVKILAGEKNFENAIH